MVCEQHVADLRAALADAFRWMKHEDACPAWVYSITWQIAEACTCKHLEAHRSVLVETGGFWPNVDAPAANS